MAEQNENDAHGTCTRTGKPGQKSFLGRIKKYGLIPAGMTVGFLAGSLFPGFREVEVMKEVKENKLVVHTVAKGENMWSIVEGKYGITDSRLIAERVKQVANSSPISRHKIDNISVVDGKVRRAGERGYKKDYIPGDQIRPGDELSLDGVPYTKKVKVKETHEKEWPNWPYGVYGAGIGGALGALGLYFSRKREDDDNDGGKRGIESDIGKARREIEEDYEAGKYEKEPASFTDAERVNKEIRETKPGVYSRYIEHVDEKRVGDVDQSFISSIEELVTLYKSGKGMKRIAKDSSYACFQDAGDVREALSLALKSRKRGQYLPRFSRDLASDLKDENGTYAIAWLKQEYENKGKTHKTMYEITNLFREKYGMSISKSSLYNCVQNFSSIISPGKS